MLMSSDFCESCDKRCCFQAAPAISEGKREEIIRRAGKEGIREIDGFFVPGTRNGFCAFLSKGMCSIHDIKPAECRTFPLVKAEKGFFIDLFCPNADRIKAKDLADWVSFAVEERQESRKPWKGIPLKDFIDQRGEGFRKDFEEGLRKHNIPEDTV
jgi:Fe-S-cluster containining protein